MSVREVIGIHSCKEALKTRSAKELKKIYFRAEWDKTPALQELALLAQKKNLKPEVKSLKKMNQIAQLHQGVCLLVEGGPRWQAETLKSDSVVLILDRIQDPKNLGALIRSAWLMGADGIFISSRHSAPLTPFVMKSASGGVEHVPIELRDNLQKCLDELKKNQFWIYTLDSRSETSLWEESLEGRVAFLLGGESSGVREGLKKASDKFLSLPQKSAEASYNVSVAGALALGEYFRQKTLKRSSDV